jgi:hypothetical protein
MNTGKRPEAIACVPNARKYREKIVRRIMASFVLFLKF